MRFFTLLIFSSILISGCVTQKKYNELLAEKVKAEGELGMTKDSLESMNELSRLLESQLTLLNDEKYALEDSLRINELETSELQAEFDKLNNYYNNLLNNSGQLTQDLAEQKQELESIRRNLEASQAKNEELSADLQEREGKVRELEDILAKKDEAVNRLKNRINNALLNFKESDLTVEVKNGKVYVSLAEQLLFQSGSIVVDPKGKTALEQLANALRDQNDINVMVEGHTDNVPIGRTSNYMKDNWDLSVMRATTIVRILTSNGVEPNQITAAGKGEFYPVDTNESADGRRNNRRTEIIITPDLDELFQILESN